MLIVFVVNLFRRPPPPCTPPTPSLALSSDELMSAPATPITPKPMEGVAGQRVGEGDKEPVDRGGGSTGHPAASQRLDSSACLQCHPRPAGVSR